MLGPLKLCRPSGEAATGFLHAPFRHVARFLRCLEDKSLCQATEPGRSSAIPAAQQLWHVSEAHLLELFKEGFWRCAGPQLTRLADL